MKIRIVEQKNLVTLKSEFIVEKKIDGKDYWESVSNFCYESKFKTFKQANKFMEQILKGNRNSQGEPVIANSIIKEKILW